MKTYFPDFYRSFSQDELGRKTVSELEEAIRKEFYPLEGDYDREGEFPLIYIISSVVREMEDVKKSKFNIFLGTSMESFHAELKIKKDLSPAFLVTIPTFWLEHGNALSCTPGFDLLPEEAQKKLTENRITTLTDLAEAITYAIVYSLFQCLLDNKQFFEIDEETEIIQLKNKTLLTSVMLATPCRMLADYPMHLLRKDNGEMFNDLDLITVLLGAKPLNDSVGRYFDNTSLNAEENYGKYLDINSILDSELVYTDITFHIEKEVLYRKAYKYALFRLDSIYEQDTINPKFYIKHKDSCNETTIWGSHRIPGPYRANRIFGSNRTRGLFSRNNYLKIDYAFVVNQLGDCFKKKKPAMLKDKYYRDWTKESVNPLLDSGNTPGELLYLIKYNGIPRDTQEED